MSYDRDCKDRSMNDFPMSPPCLLVCIMIYQRTTVKDNYLERAHPRRVENFPIYGRRALFKSLIQAC